MTSPTIEAELRWHLGPGRADFLRGRGDNPPIPLLIRLKDGTTPEEFEKAAGSLMHVPKLYTEVLPRLDPAFSRLRYITVLLDLRQYESLSDRSVTSSLPIVEVTASPPLAPGSRLADDSAKQLEMPKRPALSAASGRVVMGIIDDGIAFAHERFREVGGSRFEFFWMQDGPPPGPTDIFGPTASGRELRKLAALPQGLDALLTEPTYGNLVDEDRLYHKAGVIESERPNGHKAILWRQAHGTHVLDIACNTPLAPTDPPPDTRIIGVQLPIATTGLPVKLTLGFYIEQGIWFILLRSLFVSDRIGCGLLPVVINISYGLTTGPHDGNHSVEQMIDGIATIWKAVFGVPVEVVIASGNSHVDRLHAEVSFAKSDTVEIPWRIQPDDYTSSVVEVWLPVGPDPSSGTRVRLSVIAPDGSDTGPLNETLDPTKDEKTIATIDGVICLVQYKYLGPAGRGMFEITVNPTARYNGTDPIAPCGLWRIQLVNVGLASTDVLHAYVAIDQAPYGYPQTGRQSYFDDHDYERFDDAGRLIETDNNSIVKRYGSMNAIGTGSIPTVVGGVLRKEAVPPPYSAGGPTLSATRTGPDVVAVSDDSRVRRGVLGAGTRSGSVVSMNGTSVAAPMISRWVAGRLAAGKTGDRNAVRAKAVAAAGLDVQREGAGDLILAANLRPGVQR